ncbi:MAG: CCA tRNA nucleotidyltransferase [Alphaproteobacteria bacterium]|nr:CCA tRNA nucleotidyltransferase [Alphaproteobacteria bacterium]
MTAFLAPPQRDLILTPAVRRIMDALRHSGGEARIVGGAVRDIVMNRAAGDIDMAATLPPQQVMDILAAHGIKSVPTGLAHGTVTAVIDHKGYEITTLRRDVATDGRHADVAFTTDWRADAARRDFTFNALYADGDGAVYDYFNGIDDARAGRVRFIGDASARIREDVLRILRFFRFYAWFGRGDADPDALAACRALAALMPRLSAERVARETLKLLAAPDPAPAWQLMMECGVTRAFTPEAADVARLRHLLAKNAPPDALLRLAALLPPDDKTATAVAARLKLSTRDGDALRAYATLPAQLRGHLDPIPLRRILYRHNPDHCRAALALLDDPLDAACQTIGAWENPAFPVKGEDLLKLGVQPGPRMGDILRETEQWWIMSDFRPDRAACLAYAQTCAR